jgi:hypothetical protein
VVSKTIAISVEGIHTSDSALPLAESLYLVLGFFSMAFPTGSILGLNFKAILLLGIFALVAMEVRDQPWGDHRRRAVLILGLASFVLAVEAALSLSRGNEPALVVGQFREFLTAATLIASGFFLFGNCPDGYARVARAMLLGAAAYSIAKIGALALIISGQRSFVEVSDAAQSVFGQQVMGLEFEGSLPRFHMGQDLALPFVVYFGLNIPAPKMWARLNWVLASLIVLGVVASLSRYLWLVIAVVALLAWGSWLGRHRGVAVLVLAVTVGGMLWLAEGTEMGRATIQVRFQGDASSGGDDVRVEQNEVLVSEFLRRPLLGKGMGAYVDRLIRSDSAAYSYENQWVALLMQLGVVGGGLLALFPAWLMVRLFRRGPGFSGWSACVVCALFLGQGFFNPTLTTSASAMVLLCFTLLATGAGPGRLSSEV